MNNAYKPVEKFRIVANQSCGPLKGLEWDFLFRN
jgi:hypothetical protein